MGVMLTPWEWAAQSLQRLVLFFTEGPGHDFIVGAALFLIVGGLAILFLIASLLLLQSLVPGTPVSEAMLASAKDNRQMRPLYATAPVAPQTRWFGRPRRAEAGAAPAPRIDRALDAIVREGVGEPRLIRYSRRHAVVRMLRCRGCDMPAGEAGAAASPACQFEAEAFVDAFESSFGTPAAVSEVACHRRGQPFCDFEVNFG